MYISAGDRDSKGRFVSGSVGNPRGRPKKEPTAEEIMKGALPEALMRLLDLIHSDDEAVALQACIAVLDRALGKPEGSIRVNVDSVSMIDSLRVNCSLDRYDF